MAKSNVLKDKKITIYESVEAVINFEVVKGFKPIHPGKLWAYVRQLSAREYFIAASVQALEEMLFTINWRPDIEASMFIEYKGIWYDIKRVDSFEGYKDQLHLYASQTSTKPSPEDILPY